MGAQHAEPRHLPAIVVTNQNRFYWEGALRGRLLCQRCARCGHYLHPPVPICTRCHAAELEPTPLSGRGNVHAFTIVRRVFHPGFAQKVPYILAMVELEEQPALRMLSRIIGCEPHAASVGMAVAVSFEPHGDWLLPVFRPVHDP